MTTLAEGVPVRLRTAVPVRKLAGRLRTRGPIGLVTVAALSWYLWHALAEHFAYLTTGYDLGIFDQAMRAYSHFKAPMVPLKGAGYNIFGDHFHPIIALIAPLYWIWDNPVVLVVVQAVLVAASIPVVYAFTRRRGGEWLSLVVAAAYAFGWPIQSMIDFDFHEVAFAQPILAFAINALDQRKNKQLVVWSVLLLFVREDMGIVVVILAALWWFQRRRPWKPAVILAVVGFAAYEITTSVIIPHFARGHGFAYGNQYDALGSSVAGAAWGAIIHPWHVIKLLFSPIPKTATLGYLFVPTLLLPLRSRYTLLALPLLLERLFNSRSNLWQPHFHYNALPWLILILAAVDGAQHVRMFSTGSMVARMSRIVFSGWLIAFPILLIYNQIPIHPTAINQMRDGDSVAIDARVRASEAAVRFVPRNTCVLVDNKLVPHMTPRDWVALPHLGATTADFIVLDLDAKDVGNDGPSPSAVLADAELSNGYKQVFRQGDIVVLQSPRYTGPSKACALLGPGKGFGP